MPCKRKTKYVTVNPPKDIMERLKKKFPKAKQFR